SGSDTVKLKQIRVLGDYLSARETIKPFRFLKDSDFPASDLSMNQALAGIIKRRIGLKYIDWFEFKLDKYKNNYFKLENSNGKIRIIGNTGVNIAAGLNYYLKYYCNVNI